MPSWFLSIGKDIGTAFTGSFERPCELNLSDDTLEMRVSFGHPLGMRTKGAPRRLSSTQGELAILIGRGSLCSVTGRSSPGEGRLKPSAAGSNVVPKLRLSQTRRWLLQLGGLQATAGKPCEYDAI